MAEPSASRPRLKRPLFAKPAWAQEEKSSNATDFFRRSDQSYVDIAAEAERTRQRRLARKERERARADIHKEPAEKRQCISSDSDSGNDSGHSSSAHERVSERKVTPKSPPAQPHVHGTEQPQNPTEPKISPKSLLKRYGTVVDIKERPLPSNIIDLEDEDSPTKASHDEMVEVTAVQRREPPPEDDDFPPSDDEFAELARKAREEARRKCLEAKVLSPTPDSPSSAKPDDRFARSKLGHDPTPPPAAPDPVVSILITSRIKNTDALIVNRRASQRLKDVRLTWCQRQSFAPDFIASVFLTWRGKRLFDVTTCKSLGIGVDSNGNIVSKGQKDIMGEEDRQIHMEAVTEEILEEYQRQKRREADGDSQREAEAQEEQRPIAGKKEAQVRIILKAKGYSDFKLIVKPVSQAADLIFKGSRRLTDASSQTTLISRIVNAFKSDKKIDDDREVFLSFDGDRFAPDSQVGDTELNDMDYVDVYVK
ncbi:MAG: hypothetical protein L6R39_000200 [Caloplaca ligustica]|nr:MAG: hypothetical protein L6R39_000200 [Caloplaca ligustica]